MKFCSSPALEATCAGAAAPKFAVFAEAGPGWLASARDPLGGKERPRRTCFFCYPGPGPSGLWPGLRKCGSPTVAVVAGPRRRLGAKPADGQGFGGARGSQGAPSGTSGPPRGAPAKAHRRACRPRAGIEVAKRGGSRRGRASAIRLFDRKGRSTSHGLEPRGTRVWQFDPVDGIVYCGAKGPPGFAPRRASGA
jgi:hypothetical protein